jgi:hypothetical protein
MSHYGLRCASNLRVVRSAREFNAILGARKRARPAGGRWGLRRDGRHELGILWGCRHARPVAYLCAAAGVTSAFRRSYLQHWGLGVDGVQGADEGRFAWEDRCQFKFG